MDSEKLRSIAIQVTSELAPSKIQILECGEYSARIQVVSEAFENTSLPERFEQLYDLLYSSSTVPRAYALQFEAWTPKEYEQLQAERNHGGESGGGGGFEEDSRKVASPAVDPRQPV